jgi:high-affinity iron transporter
VLFDVSGTIDPSSWYATVLKGVLNFSPRTTVLEGLAWILYVVPTMTLFLLGARSRSARAAVPATPVSHRSGS